MRIQKGMLLLVFVLSYGFSYAGELVAKEAANYFNDGVLAQKEGRYSDAEKNYQKTILMDPSNKEWLFLIASNYFNYAVFAQKGSRYSDAEKNYQKTILMDPSNTRWPVLVANNRGVMSMEKGDLRQAEKYFLEALQIDSDFMPARVNYGFIIDKRGNELESIKYWMNLLNIDLQELKPKSLILVQEEPVKKEGVAEKAAP